MSQNKGVHLLYKCHLTWPQVNVSFVDPRNEDSRMKLAKRKLRVVLHNLNKYLCPEYFNKFVYELRNKIGKKRP